MNTSETSLSDILRLLPHRDPFLFVDKILSVEDNRRVIAEKHLDPDSGFFAGHFPGHPVMPGVLISEALAQTGGILIGIRLQAEKGVEGLAGKGVFLASVHMKYYQPALPGQTIRLEAELKKEFAGMYLFDVAAFESDKCIAKGSISLAKGELPA
ncbi:MAG: 3-hydroxyacyl-ACP dehydratase FabZ family protein [Desulfobacterales bacterium]|nr:3-hydroxyacyl-ACP dehydratase FabZ family protein [Desulfobacterales bacterium]